MPGRDPSCGVRGAPCADRCGSRPPIHEQPSARHGLTLIELLVALAILVGVSGSALLIFRGITRAWRTGELRTERYQQARLLFDLFERELTSAVASPRYPLVGQDRGDAPPLWAESAQDALWFTGTVPGRSGLVERGYWLTAEGTLMCQDDEPADGDLGTGVSELCGRDVEEMEFAYYDGETWQPRWDARPDGPQAGTLPKAVSIVLTLGRERPEEFETVVYVPTS